MPASVYDQGFQTDLVLLQVAWYKTDGRDIPGRLLTLDHFRGLYIVSRWW